jgi:D-inositol-3-phosphate glycosyltransferase
VSHPGEGARSIVGLFQHLADRRGPIVGRQVAVDDFTRALLRHGERHEYALYCHGRHRAQVAAELGDDALGATREGGSPRGSLHDRRELASTDGLAFTAWHDPQFDMHASFALRARARPRVAPWPVTVLHHTLSYKELLHDAVLRLLLAKPCAYDALVCTSTAARESLRRLIAHVAERFHADHGTRLAYRGRYELIPLAVDTERFRPQDRTLARARFGIDVDAFVLLWVGRLSALDKADLLPLVQAFATLARDNPGRKLRLVCAGSDRPGDRFGALVRELAEHLGVGGAVTVITDDARIEPGKEDLYATADVFVSPVDNVQESFGLTPVEAMACGIPQVVSDWNGYRDSVVDGETGFLVPTAWADCQGELSAGAPFTESPYDHLALSQSVVVDMSALRRCVQRLIDEPGLREAMATASRRRAEDRYAWPVVIRSHEALWSALAEEARRAPEPSEDGGRYATPDYGGFFGHFASTRLDDAAALRLTAHGRDVASGRAELPSFYIEHWQHLDPALLQRVLAGLVRADEQGATLTLGRILAVMTAKNAEPRARDVVLRHVLFLLKYGVAEQATR